MPALVVRAVAPARTRSLRQAVLRPHQPAAELAAHEVAGTFAVGAFDREELIAVGLIAPDGEPGGWRVRGMATAPGLRGQGLGARVLDALIDAARRRGAERLWCNARSGAREFYERAGFAVEGAEFELPEIGPHFLMSRSPR